MHQYLTLRKVDNTEYEYRSKLFFTLGNSIVIESRERFTIWDLASDVGGFHDSLMLMC